MIPYDDLVVALASWRAKKGLPVGQISPPAPAAKPVSAAPVAPAPATASSGSGPKRSGPPAAPPPGRSPAPGSGRTAAPAPLPLPAETIDVDEHMMDEDADVAQLETVDEFGQAFSALHSDGEEATSIGSAPGPRDSFSGGGTNPTLDPKGSIRPAGNRNDDW